MKTRIIALAVLVLTTAFVSFSQVCKISKDNDTVEVTNCSLVGDDTVEVTVENDSNDINANVTVTIEVVYKLNSSTFTKTYEGKKMAMKDGETLIKIPIASCYNNDERYKPYSVKAIAITGAKCM